MKKLLIPFVFGLVVLAAPGLARADYYFFVSMSGAGEVPPNDEPGFGEALVIVSDNLDSISVFVDFDDLTGPANFAAIQIGPPDGVGPAVLALPGFPAAPDGHYEAVLTAADIDPAYSFDDLVQDLFDGNTYMNIRTPAYAGGEIRGQIGYVGP